MGGSSINKAKKKVQKQAEAAEREAQRQAEEAKQKELQRKKRGRIGMIRTSMQGLVDADMDLKRKNLLGE